MRCETCQGSGERRVISGEFVGWRPCEDCNGSGISHCCDGIQEQRDPGDETPEFHENPIIDALLTEAADGALETLWADQLGEMERDVTGCADDCCHPSHRRGAVSIWPESDGPVALRMKIPGMSPPDTHDEWRKAQR